MGLSIKGMKESLDRLVLSIFGTASEVGSLGNERVRSGELLPVCATLCSSLALMEKVYLSMPDSLLVLSANGLLLYSIFGMARNSMDELTMIGRMRTRRAKSRVLKNLSDRVAACDSNIPLEETSTGRHFWYYNPAEYALFYLNKDLNPVALERLLRESTIGSLDLPLVGAELNYASQIPRETVIEFNDLALVLRSSIRPSSATSESSEIRLLPSRSYSFRWY